MPHSIHRVFRRIVAAALVAGATTGCLNTGEPGNPSNPATETYAPSLGVNISQMTKLSDALYIQDLTVGTGAVVGIGSSIQVTYTGWLVDGTQFDSNVGKALFPVTVGEPDLIDGWNLGLQGMKVGGKRRLVIGSDLAYGSSGNFPIGPNATIVFDITVVAPQ